MKLKSSRSISGEAKRRNIAGWLFILPFAIGFLCFFIEPMLLSLYYSFCSIHPHRGGGLDVVFDGLSNYKSALIGDSTFLKNLLNSLKQMATDTPVVLIFSLFIAVVLNQKFHGRFLARAIFFLPVVVTSGVVIGIIRGDALSQSLSQGSAISSSVLQFTGIEQVLDGMNLPNSIISAFTGIVSNVFDMLWKCGVQILLFLAALQGVSESLYEAAKIEGATGWESFWKITFPMVSPIILINVVYTIVDSFADFNNTLIKGIYSMAYSQGRYGYAMSQAWIFQIVVILVLVVVFYVSKKLIFYQNE